MKLSTIHYQYMGELHAKLHQNWWSGFRDIALHDTEGHSFIIIRMSGCMSLYKMSGCMSHLICPDVCPYTKCTFVHVLCKEDAYFKLFIPAGEQNDPRIGSLKRVILKRPCYAY